MDGVDTKDFIDDTRISRSKSIDGRLRGSDSKKFQLLHIRDQKKVSGLLLYLII
jgi:hypothetical protein